MELIREFKVYLESGDVATIRCTNMAGAINYLVYYEGIPASEIVRAERVDAKIK